MKRSWRTTTAGLATALGILLAWVLPMLGVEITDTKAEEIAGALILIVGVLWGAWAARDDVVTSEGSDARIRPGRTKH